MADQSSANVEYWNKHSDLYEELSAPAHTQFGAHVLDLAKLYLVDTPDPLFILDVAAGTGPFCIPAAQAFPTAKVLATDVSEHQLRTAKKKADVLGGLPNLECRIMDGQVLELEDNSVDLLVCMFGMMFFEDKDKGWREFRRVLKPGGRAIISTWQALGVVPPLEESRARLLGLPQGEEYPGFDRGRSMRDPSILQSQALAAGFSSVEVNSHVVVSRSCPESDVGAYVAKWLRFPTFGASIPEGKDSEYTEEIASVLRRGVDENGMIGLTNRALITVALK